MMEKMEVSSSKVSENKELSKDTFSAKTNQVLICLGIIIGSTWSGMTEDCAGAISFTNRNLLPDGTAKILEFQNYAEILGVACSAIVMKVWGRKKCLSIANILLFLGCICLMTGQQKEIAMASCMLMWFSSYAYITAARVYVAEITSSKSRGLLEALIYLAVIFGSFMNLSLRSVVAGHYGVRACFFMSTVSLILTLYTPESPYWLHLQNQPDEAKNVFLRIRGDKNIEELNALLAREVDPKAKIFTQQFFNAFFVLMSMMLVHQASGLSLIRPWEQKILQNVFAWQDDSYDYSITLESLSIFSGAVLSALILSVPRRILFFLSAGGVSISLLSWSCIKCIKSFVAPSDSMLLPLMIFHNVAVFMGCSQIPWILAAEIFPNHSRDFGFCCYAFFFMLLKRNVPTMDIVENYWFHFVIVLIGSITAYFVIPETIGTTLQEAEYKISTKLLEYS